MSILIFDIKIDMKKSKQPSQNPEDLAQKTLFFQQIQLASSLKTLTCCRKAQFYANFNM